MNLKYVKHTNYILRAPSLVLGMRLLFALRKKNVGINVGTNVGTKIGKTEEDNKGRILHNGGIQMKDGRYRFKYIDDFGKVQVLYSWRLDHNDPQPRDKKSCLSIRVLEAGKVTNNTNIRIRFVSV